MPRLKDFCIAAPVVNFIIRQVLAAWCIVEGGGRWMDIAIFVEWTYIYP